MFSSCYAGKQSQTPSGHNHDTKYTVLFLHKISPRYTKAHALKKKARELRIFEQKNIEALSVFNCSLS